MKHTKGRWDATLFDLDGTLTKKSTIPDFLMRSFPAKKLALLGGVKALPILARYLRGAPFEACFPDLSEVFLAGVKEGRLEEAGEAVIRKIWKQGMRKPVLEALLADLEGGRPVAIATGGLPYCAQALARKIGAEKEIKVFASEMEFEGIVGRRIPRILIGKEKLIAVNWARERGETLQAFGNSRGDEEMLDAVERPWWVTPSGEVIPWLRGKKGAKMKNCPHHRGEKQKNIETDIK